MSLYIKNLDLQFEIRNFYSSNSFIFFFIGMSLLISFDSISQIKWTTPSDTVELTPRIFETEAVVMIKKVRLKGDVIAN